MDYAGCKKKNSLSWVGYRSGAAQSSLGLKLKSANGANRTRRNWSRGSYSTKPHKTQKPHKPPQKIKNINAKKM